MGGEKKSVVTRLNNFLALLSAEEREELNALIEECQEMAETSESAAKFFLVSLEVKVAAFRQRKNNLLIEEASEFLLELGHLFGALKEKQLTG